MLTVTRADERDSVDRDSAPDLAESPNPHLRQIRLLVVEDHPVVRLGLVQLLEGQLDFSVEVACIDAEGAVAEAELLGVDVAIVDYHLGGRNGLWACRRLKQLAQAPRVIVFSAFANDHLATCCAVAGADGVLSKGVLGSEPLRRRQVGQPWQAPAAKAGPADRRHAASQAGRNRAIDLRDADGGNTALPDRADVGHVRTRAVFS